MKHKDHKKSRYDIRAGHMIHKAPKQANPAARIAHSADKYDFPFCIPHHLAQLIFVELMVVWIIGITNQKGTIL